MPIGTLQAVAAALDAEITLSLRWRAGDLDRLVDEAHARLVGEVLRLLERLGWEARPEVSYAVDGERGSIDILARHAPSATLLVIEVKSELTSVEETLRRHDAKVRLGRLVAADRMDWRTSAVARLLVLPASATGRRRVARHETVLGAAYPTRGPELRAWLRRPAGALSGILFLTAPGAGTGGPTMRRRVRGPGTTSRPG